MKIILIALVFVLFSSITLAQPVDRVMLVSDITSVDMLIAKAAGEKSGVPVLILENGTLTDDVLAELSGLNIKTVILVGGPAVIKTETEGQLDKFYTVIRLWGTERTGTAVEVAKYFWSEGAGCAVLADDTKNSDADTELETDAAQIAAVDNCPFLPVPMGRMPADVIALLSELNVNNATFVGLSASNEFRSKLGHLRQKEITGNKEAREREATSEIENRTRNDNATLRLVIIAAPHWRYVLGHGGHAGRHTIIRIVSNTERVPSLIELINTRNITDVRILGHPALAADIAAQLETRNITVKKVSGERASEVAIKALRESWDKWQERRKQAFGNETHVRTKNPIKKHITNMVNKLERDLNRLENELTELNSSGANSTALALLKSRIDTAQSQLGAIRDYITNDNLDTAKRRIALLRSDVMKIRWLYRMELRINTSRDVSAEEE